MKRLLFNSLRARYLAFAVILGAVIISGFYLVYHSSSRSGEEAAANLALRSRLSSDTRHIRAHIFRAYQSLDGFLLDPTRSSYRDAVHTEIAQALTYSDRLRLNPWVSAQAQSTLVTALHRALQQLDREVEQVIQTRIDPFRQYPSLAVGNRVLAPNRDAFNNALVVALTEVQEPPLTGHRMDVFRALVQVRYLWDQMVSDFRNYLSNRVGSFNEAVLATQVAAIQTLHGQLEIELQELQRMDDAGRLGFQGSVALQDMKRSLRGWYDGFQRIKVINETGTWRADTELIKTSIEPRLDEIAGLLDELDHRIETSAANDVQLLSGVARTQTQMLGLVAAVGLLFMVVVLVSMERLVFRPIALVVRALKTHAFGREPVQLPRVRSAETQELFDAFDEMDRQVRNRQADLEHQALHDGLTGLPNRVLLQDRIEQTIHAARRTGQNVALLVIDLNRFKDINDTLGHQVGDHLLTEVGARLLHAVREGDSVARLGGDEFAILLPGTDAARAAELASRVSTALESAFDFQAMPLYVGASIGIAVFPLHATDAHTLVQRADVAMYVAKRNRLTHVVYDAAEDEYSIGRLALVAELRDALENETLELYYQPTLDIRQSRVLGVEALLRWTQASCGMVPTDELIALAEQTGLITPLTYWVLESALGQVTAWRRSGLQLSLAVNLSVHNLRDPKLVERVQASLQRHGLPAASLTLEITESAMMANPVHAVEVLSQLDAMGVQLAVDDFGTGFSSLSYLKQLPVDQLKIDRSFVMGLPHDASDEVIVRSTIELAHNLGLRVIAEGVETESAWRRLQQLHCDAAQGFYLSPPLPANEVTRWLESYSRTG